MIKFLHTLIQLLTCSLSLIFWVLALSFALPTESCCQKRANIWYFGDHAGLDFNSGKPVSLTNGALKTYEGCASICDTTGRLLFYTDGITVYDSTHSTMQNGTGLKGNNSATEAALIVPEPGNDSIYFIFTVDAQSGPDGLQYSLVNMNNNYGKGAVISKNNLLFTISDEKITAVKHNNGMDFWVIGHKHACDSFYVYQINKSGLVGSPVKSGIGSSMNTKSGAIGYMKASSDGKRIALALSATNTVELFDFDDKTGQISNCRSMTDATNFSGVYGLEFSPDCSKLYISTYNSPRKICQVDITASTSTKILNSLVIIASSTTDYFWALQLAPDHKIYVAKEIDTLGVIDLPDNPGKLCKFISGGVYLGGKKAILGLPTFIQSFFEKPIIVARNFCYKDSTKFDLPGTLADSLIWNFGDTVHNFSKISSPVHNFSHLGTYTVTCRKYINGVADTSKKIITIVGVTPFDLGKDTSLCEGTKYKLNVNCKNCSYLWQDNSTDTIFTIIKAGKYWLTLNNSGCKLADTLQVKYIPLPKVNLGNDTGFCKVPAIRLNAITNATSYVWQDGTTDSFLMINNPGKYWVIAKNGCGTITDTIAFAQKKIPVLHFTKDTLLCQGSTFILHATNPGCSYLWQDGLRDSIYKISKAGKFKITVSGPGGCSATDSINVALMAKAKVNLGNDTTLCKGFSIKLSAAFPGATCIWQDGIADSERIVTTAGKYLVTVTNSCNSVKDSITINYLSRPQKSLPPDSILCDGKSFLLNAGCKNCNYVWQDSSINPTFLVNNAGRYTVIRSNQCGILKESTQISRGKSPMVNLGHDTTLCFGESIFLSAAGNGYIYLWQDNSKNAFYHVHSPFIYKVIVTNQCGRAGDSIKVDYRDCDCHLFVPNAFSPNNDGLNDYFLPSGCETTKYDMKIMDRWGEIIFESTNILSGWDGTFHGKTVPEGLYCCIISLNDRDNINQYKSNSFILIR
jgi:gliding motility-associated-like protein